MTVFTITSRAASALLCATVALTLAACGQAEEETTYEVEAEDLSGGELQVADPAPEAVPATIPQTQMTNAPPQEAAPTPEE